MLRSWETWVAWVAWVAGAALLAWFLRTALRVRLWTVLPIIPHLFGLWLPCVLFLLLRRCWVGLMLAARRFVDLFLGSSLTLSAQSCGRMQNGRLALVIPCHNLQDGIERVVDAALEAVSDVKIFIVDSGSTDNTWQVLQQLKKRGRAADVTRCGLGRSLALNTGAVLALSSSWEPEIIMFLHGDTLIPPGYDQEVRRIMGEPGVAMGHFSFQWDGCVSDPVMQFNQWYVNARSNWLKLPWGDMAFFMRSEVFRRVGGFPALPLMEDSAILMQLERLGSIIPANAKVSTRAVKFASMAGGEPKVVWRRLKQMVRNHLLAVGWICGLLSPWATYASYYPGQPMPELKSFQELEEEAMHTGCKKRR